MNLYLTANDGAFLGPIAKGLGWIMDKIYIFLSGLGFDSIALTIVVFTIFVYLCMFPLTYKQQKFAVLSRKMQPEIKAVQDKYKGKKDQASMSAMQEETQQVYDKYGISPTGSCIYMVIQMPILFALYRVFFNVPAYITSVKGLFGDLVTGIMGTEGYRDTMTSIVDAAKISNLKVDFAAKTKTEVSNYIIDALYKFSDSNWDTLRDSFPNLTDSINSTVASLKDINYLFVLNISDTPWNLIKASFTNKTWIVLICALLVPVLSYLTQVLNIKLVPQNTTDQNDQMAKQMKTMNMMMPLMSLFICFTVPVGLGLYWIAGAVVRLVQQFFLNKHFEKIDPQEIIEKNKEKAAEKAEKRGIRQAQIYNSATMSTKNSMMDKATFGEEKIAELDRVSEVRAKAQPGTMTSKANLVKDFNERNNK